MWLNIHENNNYVPEITIATLNSVFYWRKKSTDNIVNELIMQQLNGS